MHSFITLAIIFSFFSFQEDIKPPKITDLGWGRITINKIPYQKDVVIKNGEVEKRNKKVSKSFKTDYGHTPLTLQENIPWDCDTLIIGIGMSGKLPITEAVKSKAKEKGIALIMLKTRKAVEYFKTHYSKRINAIFHLTC